MNEQGKQNLKKREVLAITVYFPKSDQARWVQNIYHIYYSHIPSWNNKNNKYNDPAQTRNAVSESLESHSVTVAEDSCINTCPEVSNQSSSSSFTLPAGP